MPERPDPKVKPHPWAEFWREPMLRSMHGGNELPDDDRAMVRRTSKQRYAELHVTSNFTFLTGASHPEELIEQAATIGHHAITITDVNSLAGIVRAHVGAKQHGIQFIVGCRLQLQHGRDVADCPMAEPGANGMDDVSILVYPTNRATYGRLCRLLTLGKRCAPKGECHLTLHDLLDHHEGLLAIVIPPHNLDQSFLEVVEGLRRTFNDDRLSIAASALYGEDDRTRLQQLASLADHTRVPLVATNDVHYHTPARRPLQDVLTCIRHGCTIEQAGLRLFPHAERYLKPPGEMHRLFADHPQAIARTLDIAERTKDFSLDELRYQYPSEIVPHGSTMMQHLTDLTWAGAADRYPTGTPAKVRNKIEHELRLIDELNYAPYFLTVHDIVKFAGSRDILCQGRGAAANSAVCYTLGITSVDPDRINLLFERFISKERNEPPDIDVDFEHERREEVIQYIYNKYGRDRAALTAEVITYRGRSAVREVGKAIGLSLDAVDRLAKDLDWWSDQVGNTNRLRALGFNPDQPVIRALTHLSKEILGFPRHLSQHVGGFVISDCSLCELVPIENAAMDDRTVIEWDKDDIDALGMLKVDCLGLGMLTCIRKAFDFINNSAACGLAPPDDRENLALHTVPLEDPIVYDMICEADTIGVFQIESRAQMTMLPRLRPRCFYDLVIEVAIVRPGPIQGDMVHPYLRRRTGEEPVTYPTEEVKRVLERTLGVPLFQEQAMSLAIVAAGFTPDEADQLRRAMAAWKRKGDRLLSFEDKFIGGMIERGYQREFAERCFKQLRGFSEYGFPESHAASFAHLVYVSCWLKKHHPAAFAAALINSQPMGFYAPAQIVRDAQDHGAEVRPVDVNHSAWDCTLEAACGLARDPQPALRLGMRLIKGLREEHAHAITNAVQRERRFTSIESLHRTARIPVTALRKLANADAFTSMGLDRQSALWHIRKLRDKDLPLFDQAECETNGLAKPDTTRCLDTALPSCLPPVSAPSRILHDYATLGLSLKAHPISFLREDLTTRRTTRARELKNETRWPHGKRITVAGLVLVRQRPATASGIIFITLEDETGITNLIVRPHIYQRFRRAARHATILLARGTIERQAQVVHVLCTSLASLDEHFSDLVARSRDFR
jgi:error-prone DNA polymerase